MRLGFCGSLTDAEAVKAAGFDFLEVNVQQLLKGRLSEADWQASAPDPDKLVLPIEAANCLIPGDMPVVGPKRDLDELNRYMKRVAHRAARLGIWSLVFGSGAARRRPEDVPPRLAQEHLQEFLDIAGDACAARNVTVVIEHLNRNETNTLNRLDDCLALCDRVANPGVAMLVDTYHFGLEHEDDQAVVDLGDRLKHVHVAEPVGRIQPGGHGEASPDAFDFVGFFALLNKIGYDGRISFEGRLTAPLPECGHRLVAYLRDAWQAAREGVAD